MNKLKLMKLALQNANKAGNKTFPNPNVGAVLVKNGQVIAQGYHRFFGDQHAEIHAIKLAGENAKNSELFVTLEPCSHYGKTPPCTDAIINAGIKKVYVGINDPNPLVNGKGIKKLIDAGIEVESGILEKELKKFYADYLKRFNEKSSFVVLKYAMTLDGKIASSTGDSKWISSETAREWVHKYRTNFDGILVGVNTIIKDNPSLTSHGKGNNPVRVIIDPELIIPLKSKVLNDEYPSVIIHSVKNSKKINAIKAKGKIPLFIKSRKKLIDFNDILSELRKISIIRVLIEGGGETAWFALKSNTVDKIIAIVAPKILGGKNSITPVEGTGFKKISESIKSEIIEIKKFGDDVLIKSKIIKSAK